MAQTQFQKDYYFKQVYKIRESALYVAVFCVGIFLYLDYLRFSGTVYQQVLSIRISYQVIPVLAILFASLIHKSRDFDRSKLNYLASFCVIFIGFGHAEIYHIAHSNNAYFPKFGLAIVLFYAGILLVLPLVQAFLSSATVIAYATYTYASMGEPFNEVITVTVFYSVFSICCVWMNWICTKVLLTNLRMVKHINQLANTDNLTQLKNRRFFFEQSEYAQKSALREQKSFAVLLIDLDNFKQINDQLGHQKGDQIIIDVSQVLMSKCRRPMDLAARLGGDEFVIFLYGSNLNHIKSVCDSIIEEIKEISTTLQFEHKIKGFGVSIGVAQNTKNECFLVEQLIDMADIELYKVKAKSKNAFRIADKSQYQQQESINPDGPKASSLPVSDD